jgi:hypothetical protein
MAAGYRRTFARAENGGTEARANRQIAMSTSIRGPESPQYAIGSYSFSNYYL